MKTGFALLEHNNSKVADYKALIFDLLQQTMQKYGDSIKHSQMSNVGKIIDLLYQQENLATPMAEFVGLVVERQGK